jgi:protein-S-isoprenylcysteine O-methyltransferase Ste14
MGPLPHLGPLVALHVAFYATYSLRAIGGRAAATGTTAEAGVAKAAPHAIALLVAHALAVMVLYAAVALAAVDPPRWLARPRPALGAASIAIGVGFAAWALVVFRSYRLSAQLERGHRLCTEGPFRIVRHPIYLAFDLLALGTLLWVPTAPVLAGAVLTVVVADLRARQEERLLGAAFGEPYAAYRARVARTIPFVY